MSPAELLTFLNEFYRETLELFKARQTQRAIGRGLRRQQRLSAGARAARKCTFSGWAMRSRRSAARLPIRRIRSSGKASRETAKSIIDADAAQPEGFIDRWTPRVAAVTNARHRKMLELILGEMKEHLRVLQQAAESRADLLGRHSDGKVLRGTVMAARPKN